MIRLDEDKLSRPDLSEPKSETPGAAQLIHSNFDGCDVDLDIHLPFSYIPFISRKVFSASAKS